MKKRRKETVHVQDTNQIIRAIPHWMVKRSYFSQLQQILIK